MFIIISPVYLTGAHHLSILSFILVYFIVIELYRSLQCIFYLYNEHALNNSSLIVLFQYRTTDYCTVQGLYSSSLNDRFLHRTIHYLFEPVLYNSSLPKYISNFPYFTGFPACALAKQYVFSLIFALMR